MSLRVAFLDLNGTTLDLSPVAAALGGAEEGDSALVASAVDTAIAVALTLRETGSKLDFPAALQLGLGIELERRRGVAADAGELDRAVAAVGESVPFPEALAALRELRAGGVAPWLLTNSGTAAAAAALSGTDIEQGFDGVVSVEEAGDLKPAAPVYSLALERAGVAAADAVLISAHWWDLLGAAGAGMQVAHVARPAKPLPAGILRPTATGGDLLELARALLADGARPGSS